MPGKNAIRFSQSANLSNYRRKRLTKWQVNHKYQYYSRTKLSKLLLDWILAIILNGRNIRRNSLKNTYLSNSTHHIRCIKLTFAAVVKLSTFVPPRSLHTPALLALLTTDQKIWSYIVHCHNKNGGIMPQCIRADQIISLVLIERLHYCIKHYFSSTLTTIHVCHICNLSVRLGRYYNSAKTRLRLARYMPHNYICFRFSAMAFSFLYNFSYYFAYFCFSF